MTERRENKANVFAGEINRRFEASLLEVQGSDDIEGLVNGAMNYALLREAALVAKGREADEPNASVREQFYQMREDHAAQAAAV